MQLKKLGQQVEIPETPTEDEYPPFVKPEGAHDAYQKGAGITFNGEKYESLIDNNVWAPDVYPQGWKKVEETENTETGVVDNE